MLIQIEYISSLTEQLHLHKPTMYSTKLGDKSVLVVTSPQHMLREILTLKKSDFTDVGGLPTFESPIDPKSLVRKNINNIDVPEDLALR